MEIRLKNENPVNFFLINYTFSYLANFRPKFCRETNFKQRTYCWNTNTAMKQDIKQAIYIENKQKKFLFF